MILEPSHPTGRGPAHWFTGEVFVEPVAARKPDPSRFTMTVVRFTPASRTNWHSHERGQTVHVTAGVALFGTRDGAVLVVRPGQTVWFAPGEEHWHGAAPHRLMEHLAVLEEADQPEESTTWLEPVTDEQYAQAVLALNPEER